MLTTVLLLLTAAYSGWAIGANDTANCIGTVVGGGIMRYRTAVILVAVFIVLGASLQGHYVMQTVGKGIIITSPEAYAAVNCCPAPPEIDSHFPGGCLSDLAIFVALFSAATFVTLATYFKLPVSTSQAIVGGVAGTGLAVVGWQPTYFKLAVCVRIVGSWILCPVLTLILAFLIYMTLLWFLRRARTHVVWNRVLRVSAIAAAAYSAYSLGANDVGNAIGVLLNRYPDKVALLALVGGIVLAIGGLTYGKGVVETVGKSITPLDMAGAFSAQLSGAFGIHLFSMLGIPVSTSQAVVGAVIGVGLVKGARSVSKKTIGQIAVGWVLAPSCAALFSVILYRLLGFIL